MVQKKIFNKNNFKNNKVFQDKKEKLINKIYAERPEVLAAKRFTGFIVILWLFSRILAIAAEYIAVSKGLLDFSVLNPLLLLFMSLFVWTIYQGIKTLAMLPFIASIFVIVQTFVEHIYSLLSSGNIYLIIYACLFIISAYAQFVFILYLVSNKKSNVYYDAMKEVAKALEK